MQAPIHHFHELFAQLGLPGDEQDIHHFLAAHTPLDARLKLSEAPFWTSAQATFLREGVQDDSDWALLIDQLNQALRQPRQQQA